MLAWNLRDSYTFATTHDASLRWQIPTQLNGAQFICVRLHVNLCTGSTLQHTKAKDIVCDRNRGGGGGGSSKALQQLGIPPLGYQPSKGSAANTESTRGAHMSL
jgi:hypothetical protein